MRPTESCVHGLAGAPADARADGRLLGVHERRFRRYIDSYDEDGLAGLLDKRLTQVSHRRVR